MLVDDLYLYSVMLGCVHVHKAHGDVVDRRGQQNTIWDACEPYEMIQSIMKQVFQRFRLIRCAYESLRCLDLEMWRFLCRQTDKLIALPLLRMHAHRVII